MSKIPKHLQEKLEQIKDPSLHFQCGDYTCVAHKSFKEGASAMHSLMLEEMKPIVEALKLIAEPNIFIAENGWRDEHFLDVKQAEEALSHYREKIEGVK